MKVPLRNLPCKRRGATLVETAIVLGAFLIFLFGIFEFGRLIMVRHLLDNAAREGARLAVVNTGNLTTTQIEDAIRAKLAGQVTSPTISIYKVNPSNGANLGAWTSAGYGEHIAVQVTANYNWILPPFWNSQGMTSTSTTLTTTSIMCSEANN